MYNKLNRNFYKKNAVDLAIDLLGKYLVYNIKKPERLNYKMNTLIGKIVETEAYMGFFDKGAHTYNGRRTERTEVMYGEAGHAYIYLIYGMYNCLNVVAAEKEVGQAVLIRALEPIKGKNDMSIFRYNKPLIDLSKNQLKNLTNGPGKLCKAFDITRDLNGEDLTKNRLFICEKNSGEKKINIVKAKRIGIDYAEEAKDFLWRFYIKDNKHVSVY
ncbi:MAG: DNA-3-methyladenine glycosylase [Firmicutes bacterium]|nr:DNA-3-methyladenine glycosylase [Bacillota bacterium]